MIKFNYISNHVRPKLFIIGILYSTLFVSTAYLVTLITGVAIQFPTQLAYAQTNSPKPKTSATPKPLVVQMEKVATTSANTLGIDNGSWSGEIISNSDVAVYPQQEGAIVQWNTGVGHQVKAGQILGKLSAPPVNLERNATLAEKQAEVSNARSRFAATQSNVQISKQKMQERIKAITEQRDTDYKLQEREGDPQIRKNEKAKTDAEWSEKVTEADVESAALDSELAQAQGELRAAEAAYGAISRGIDTNIYALKDGVVSGIFKNIGDYVTPETLIASVGNSASNQNDKIVRFYIPSSYTAPTKGSGVKITRPGYPFTAIPAEITGVGTALDRNGSYVAEAKFNESVEWPVHTSVRVVNDALGSQRVFIPMAALWWDDKGVAKVWSVEEDKKATAKTVKAGRTIGDRVEITEGLSQETTYIARTVPGIKEGSAVAKFQEGGATTKSSSGDGHDHEH